jgi:hypothetical protein
VKPADLLHEAAKRELNVTRQTELCALHPLAFATETGFRRTDEHHSVPWRALSLAHLPMHETDVLEWDHPAHARIELPVGDQLIERACLLIVSAV